jgi:GNAT superfamily N-acetyltransferase
MSFTVRRATPADYPIFARLFRELGVHDPTPDHDEFTSAMLPRVLILDEGSEPVGYVFWYFHGRVVHLSHLVVDPRARRRGAGRALLEAARAIIVEAGCERWYLHVKRENAAAIHLYESCGFRPHHEALALRLGWAQASALARPAIAPAVFLASTDDDAAIAARFDIEPERLARFRARPGWVFVAARDGESLVAFAAFNPLPSRAHVFHVTRPELGSLLFDALRAHARPDGPEALYFPVEGDPELAAAFQAAGAEVLHEIVQMRAELH